MEGSGVMANPSLGRGDGNSGLYGEAMPERCSLFRLQVIIMLSINK